MDDMYVLEHFNSNFIELPDYHHMWFEQCYEIASRILESYSDKDIAESVYAIDRHTEEYFPYDLPLHFNQKEPLHLLDDYIYTTTGRCGYMSLSESMWRGKTPHGIGLTVNTWPEAFAAHTYGLIAYADRDTRFMENNDDLNKENLIIEICGEYISETMEAVTTADILYRQNSPDDKLDIPKIITQERQKIARQGGAAKAKKYEPLKNEVTKIYREKYHGKTSNRNSAKLIWEELPNQIKTGSDGRSIIREEGAIERIAKWIADFKRSI